MKAMHKQSLRARNVTTDHKLFIEVDGREVRRNICEVYKNRNIVKITYREPHPYVHFVTVEAKPMHRVKVLA